MAMMRSACGRMRLAAPEPLRPSGPSANAWVEAKASGEYCKAPTGMPVRVASAAIAPPAASLMRPRPTTNTGRFAAASSAGTSSSCALVHEGNCVLR